MSNPLIYIPIEPLTERYTEQWYRRFPEEFEKSNYQVTIIEGTPLVDDDIKVGTFLDINSTTHYKWTQLQQISKLFHEGKVRHGTTFFFGDIEFWGLEGIRVLAQLNKIEVNIVGFLHAASYTIEDALQVAADYQRFTEIGWIAACDQVYVGSNYHKRAVISRRLVPHNAGYLAERVLVTSNPLFTDEYPEVDHTLPRQKKILLTNRFDKEKRPMQTLNLFKALKIEFPDWEFVVTTSRKTLRTNQPGLLEVARELEASGVITIKDGLTKAQYHQELATASAVVTHSIEENYGYCITEALWHGARVFATKNASHEELLTFPYLFDRGTYDIGIPLLREYIEKVNNNDLENSLFYEVPTVNTKGMQNILQALNELP